MFYFLGGSNKKLRWAGGGGGARTTPIYVAMSPNRGVSARSAPARTRGQIPLVNKEAHTDLAIWSLTKSSNARRTW